MKYIITERQLKFLKEENNTGILKIPYIMVGNDWLELQNVINDMGDPPPPYIIEGDVDLRDVYVVTLGSLVGVEGNLDLGYHENFTDFKNLQYVGGNLNLFGSAIKSLGNLVYVGGNLDLEFSNIESLGNLKYVGGYLYSYNTNITSLEKLESVGSYLNLGLSKIESLGNLKYVGNYLDLMNTPFSEKKTKEDIRNIPNLTIEGEIYL